MDDLVNKTVVDFLRSWRKTPTFIGALVTGSQVTTFVNQQSDIDIYIILSDTVESREIGATRLNGFLIEYFANPIKQINSYFEQERQVGSCMTSRMLAMGRIVYDKNGAVLKLKRKAEENCNKPLEGIKGVRLDMVKYGIWEAVEKFEVSSKNGYKAADFNYNYALLEIIRGYSRYLGIDFGAIFKIWDFFNNKDYTKAYKMIGFPDKKFVKLFDKAILSPTKSAKLFALKTLSKYTLNKMGGFEIAKFRIESKIYL